MEQEQIIAREKRHNKIFFFVFFLLILGSIAFTFYRIYIRLDYQIVAETSCDPQIEIEGACFVRDEEIIITTPEGVEETTTETSYYKIINKTASHIAACEKTEDKLGCNEELSCLENENDCSYEYCTDDNVPEEESCYSNEIINEE
ncbi:MAG: hypothetical protein WAV11_02445 [Minisyncoccia bacterium]